jgi:hypothetical protein
MPAPVSQQCSVVVYYPFVASIRERETKDQFNNAMVVPMKGSDRVCIWQEYGIRRSVFVGVFGSNPASVVMK